MTETPIDAAYTRMTDSPDDDAGRLAFYERVADAELHLLLEVEAEGDAITPRIFELGEGSFVLAFDREERLTAFAGGPAPYASLSGRTLVGLLSGQKLGIGLNLGVETSETLIPPGTVVWLSETLAGRPDELEDQPREFLPPKGLPETLIAALDTKLATASGLAGLAYLAQVTWQSGRRGYLMVIIDPLPGAEPALARAVNEALIFSGIDAAELDVTFLSAHDPKAATLARVALRFDLPEAPRSDEPSAPGMDPGRPPKLR